MELKVCGVDVGSNAIDDEAESPDPLGLWVLHVIN